MQTTLIEWTEMSWNPATGCTKVSAGCDNCYAERDAERFRGTKAFPNGFALTLKPHKLDAPLKLRRPSTIFVNSMSDVFHKDIPADYLDAIFAVMEQANWHIFQVLTKRSSLMRDYVRARYGGARAPAHIWLGVSVEDEQAKV